MKSFMCMAVFIALVGKALAECNNMCSGNGVCGANDQCHCYRNWRGADCSERTCQFGRAFIDGPQGDLDHDGAVTFASANNEYQFRQADGSQQTAEAAPPAARSIDYSRQPNDSYNYVNVDWEDYTMGPYNYLFHKVRTQWASSTFEFMPPSNAVNYVNHVYMECSNKGLCDRTSGECQCFPGYEGSSCQRTSCPNKCSGHGVCRSVKDIVGSIADNANHTYALWDGEKIQSCVCDPGYKGYDCSERTCPHGDDPLHGATSQVDHVQAFEVTNAGTNAQVFFRFTDYYGDEWDTTTFTPTTYASSTSDDGVAAALKALPNSAIPGVTVSVSANTGASKVKIYTVTFTSNPGNQAGKLKVMVKNAGGGFALLASNIDDKQGNIGVQVTAGTKTNTECSGRGLCDYETGICKCFRGYRLQACNGQSSLAY